MKLKDVLRRLNSTNILMKFIIFVGYLLFSLSVRFLFLLFALIYPIKKNKVVFCNMKGKRYGDNPLYISNALLKKAPDYEIVWLLDKDVDVQLPKGIKRTDYNLINRIKELSTSKVWVDSNMKDLGTYRKKNQLYIQTWHGSYGLKRIGLDLGKEMPLIDRYIYPYNAIITNCMVSNSEATTNIYRRAFVFKGKILEVGSPRNDVFFHKNSSVLKEVDEAFNIYGKKVALYAPTWRKGYSIDAFDINATEIISALKKRFGGEWIILIRLHPHNISDATKIAYDSNVKNATYFPNMQDLLLRSDVLITDYSSCMFDFITNVKPCFLYANDIEEYESSQGNYYNLSDLPFPLAQSTNELVDNIKNFNPSDYEAKVVSLHQKVGLCESGHASEKIADFIIDYIEKDKGL